MKKLTQLNVNGEPMMTSTSSGTGNSPSDCMSFELFNKVSTWQGGYVCEYGWVAGDAEVTPGGDPNAGKCYDEEIGDYVICSGEIPTEMCYDYDRSEYVHCNELYLIEQCYDEEYGYYDCDYGPSDPGNEDPTSGGGIGGGTPLPPNQPEFRENCPSSAVSHASSVQSIIDAGIFDYRGAEDITPRIDEMRQLAAQSNIENALVINYNPDREDSGYYIYAPDGVPIRTGTKNSVAIEASFNTYWILHNHPEGTNACPSPLDIIATIEIMKDQYIQTSKGGNLGYTNLNGSIIFANNGSEYVISVNDKSKAQAFFNDSGNDSFFKAAGDSDPNFNAGTVWKTEYDNAKENLLNRGFSEEIAQSYALSHVLDHFEMGLKIMKRDDPSTDFKEQKTDIDNRGNLVPTICR